MVGDTRRTPREARSMLGFWTLQRTRIAVYMLASYLALC